MEWKLLKPTKENLSNNKTFFVEGYHSLIKSRNYLITARDQDDKEITFYMLEGDSLKERVCFNFDEIDKKRYVFKDIATRQKYLGQSSSIVGYDLNDFVPLKPHHYNFEWGSVLYRSGPTYVVKFETFEELQSYKVWMIDADANYLKSPVLSDLQVGNELYLHIAEKHYYEIVKVVSFLNEKSPFSDKDIVVKDKEGSNFEIKLNSDVYLPPWEQKFIFNDSLNEYRLDAYVDRFVDEHFVNVYWKKLDEAAAYKVRFYIKPDKTLYLMKEVELDRNKTMTTLDHISAYHVIVVVIAEDREGNVIAKTRGIKEARPVEFSYLDY